MNESSRSGNHCFTITVYPQQNKPKSSKLSRVARADSSRVTHFGLLSLLVVRDCLHKQFNVDNRVNDVRIGH